MPPQEILTRDSVTVTVDAVCYYRTFNPVVTVTNVENATHSTRLLAVYSFGYDLARVGTVMNVQNDRFYYFALLFLFSSTILRDPIKF